MSTLRSHLRGWRHPFSSCRRPIPRRGSGYPGGPAPGWHPVKPDGTLGNDVLNTDAKFSVYDSTRLDVLRTGTNRTGSSSSTPGKYTPGTSGYYAGLIKSTNGGTSITMKVSGSSTITYQWVPPNNAAGQPDLTNFPAPPLYILGRIDAACSMSGDPGQGVTGNGSLSDGWGWSVSASMVPFSLPVPASDSIRRKVLPVGMGSPAVFTLPPGGYVAAYRGGTEGEAQGGITIDEYVYPITLASPNPLTNPLLGDGSNQYVYETSQPSGQLTVPASVYVHGASTPDTTFLLPHVSLSVSPVMQTGAQPFTWTALDAGLYVNTTGARPGYVTGWPSGNFCYIGLPPDNTYFGNHVMTMKVDGTASQIANYQLFYTGTATNHPNPDSYNSTDWYYYYSGVYTPFSMANSAHYQQSSSSSDVSFTEGASPFTVHMKDSAYSTSYNTYDLRVFDIDPGFPKYARFIGYLTFPGGIMQFIHEKAHERGHQALFQMGTDGPIYTHSTNYQDPNSSEDGDIVADNWEAAHHLNAGASDTTHAYAGSGPNDAGDRDGEFLADVQALAVVFNQFNDWQQDWADGGVQKGAQSFLVPNPTSGVAPGFSLTFTPARASLDGTWTSTGSPQQIKTLGQIPTINQNVNGASAGTVVISLATLGP